MSGIKPGGNESGIANDHLTAIEKAERRSSWVYNWLFLSVFFSVPWMLVNLLAVELTTRGSMGSYVLAVLTPASIHLILLKDRKSPHAFVRAHARQGMLLAGIRSFSAVYFVGLLQGKGIMGWFAINGLLWLLGSIWGWRQVSRGDCWLVRQGIWSPGEPLQLPRPWALPASERPAAMKAAPETMKEPIPADRPLAGATAYQPPAPLAGSAMDLDFERLLYRAEVALDRGQREEAIAQYMTIFRNGPKGIQHTAIERLKEMDEVEVF